MKNLPAVRETWVRSLVGKVPWRRQWQPTPVFLPGESQGQRSLAGYSPWGHKEPDTTERLILLLKEVCKDGQTGPQLQGSPQQLVPGCPAPGPHSRPWMGPALRTRPAQSSPPQGGWPPGAPERLPSHLGPAPGKGRLHSEWGWVGTVMIIRFTERSRADLAPSAHFFKKTLEPKWFLPCRDNKATCHCPDIPD